MRSNTLMPLLQFIEWWGIDPWWVAGIDYDGSATGPSALRTSPTDRCDCMVQHPWVSPNAWSRDDFIQMIEFAEIFFINEANFYPAPFYIEGELKQYPQKNASLGYSILKGTGKPKSVKPDHPCHIQGFGAYSLELIDTVTLDRSNLDEFTVDVTVVAGTTVDELRVYFTSADGGYSGTPDFNDHLFEIRPLTITVNGTTATITGPSYLFKKPELDEEEECVAHELDTYIEDVAVYLVIQDGCTQGNFLCFVDDCQYVPCEPVRYPICIGEKTVGRQKWAMPYPAECNESQELVQYCLSCMPDEVEINYANGVALSAGGSMPDKYVNILSMLAVGLADCIKPWCDCLNCPEKKVKYYRSHPLALVQTEKDTSEYDLSWQLVLSAGTVKMLRGLPPYNGILQAMRYINTEKCIALEGATYV